METAGVFVGVTLLLYGAASVLYLWLVGGGSERVREAGVVAMALGLASHTGAIVSVGVALGRAPFTNLYESLLFWSWAMAGIYLVMARKHRITALGAFVSLAALAVLAAASFIPKGTNAALLPALRSHWSSIHVTTCLISYASYALGFGAAVAYVVQERLLKRKKINSLQKHLPSLDALDQLAYKMVSIGFPMLTLGVITGAMWAQSAWDSYWSWDPKETWSLITWLVYAAYLHVRIVHKWRGRWANRLLMVGFACVLVTFFAVNFLAHGLHRYSW